LPRAGERTPANLLSPSLLEQAQATRSIIPAPSFPWRSWLDLAHGVAQDADPVDLYLNNITGG
jgi:hypothetical protein